ncbi:hypothetical protein BAE44_0000669, partial [Dichanthelium oligosanthes]
LFMAAVGSASASGWSTADGGYSPSNLGARKLLACVPTGCSCVILFFRLACCNGICPASGLCP